jgi:hypothetical protein
MPSPFCKKLHRRAGSPSFVPSFRFDAPLQKVQRAVLFPPFVEARLRNVSMLTFSRRRFGLVRQEVPFTHAKPLCLDAEARNFQHAEDCACMTCRRQTDSLFSCGGYTFLDPRFFHVSRLTWCTGPGRPRVQRLNTSRGSNGLVQDRCAGDNV